MRCFHLGKLILVLHPLLIYNVYHIEMKMSPPPPQRERQNHSNVVSFDSLGIHVIIIKYKELHMHVY